MTQRNLFPGVNTWTFHCWEVVRVKLLHPEGPDRWRVSEGDDGLQTFAADITQLFATKEEAGLAMFEAAHNYVYHSDRELADLTARRDAAMRV